MTFIAKNADFIKSGWFRTTVSGISNGMDGYSLDQFVTFVAVVDEGSFAAAARRMNRAHSAVTYAIQQLERRSGAALFDRSSYRPTLTDAGHALLPRARRIVADVAECGSIAQGLSAGVEAEISLLVDMFVPKRVVIDALKGLHAAYPSVRLRVSIDFGKSIAEVLASGNVDLSIVIDFESTLKNFIRNRCGEVALVVVAAPHHPLGRLQGEIEPELLRGYMQLSVMSRTTSRGDKEFGVTANNCWHVSDLETKRTMLLAGLGWGSMPEHLVEADLQSGALVQLRPTRWDGLDRLPRLPVVIASRKGKEPGPATQWLIDALQAGFNVK